MKLHPTNFSFARDGTYWRRIHEGNFFAFVFQNRFEDTLSEFIKRGDFIKYSDDHCTSQATDQLLEIALNFVKNTNTELKAKQDNIENLPREDAKTRQSL